MGGVMKGSRSLPCSRGIRGGGPPRQFPSSTAASPPLPPHPTHSLPLPQEYFHETLQNDWGVFFWRPPGFLSNWTSSPFRYEGVPYHNAEQAIMHRKALLFRDDATADRIMSTTDPRQQKAYGRQVRGFDLKTWEEFIPGLLFGILHAKFSQNQAFGCALLETGSKQLFESSPMDLVWGTGVSPQKAVLCSRDDARRWKGKNLLGKTLMKVRDALASACEENIVSSVGSTTQENIVSSVGSTTRSNSNDNSSLIVEQSQHQRQLVKKS